MKPYKVLLSICMLVLLIPLAAGAADFGWMSDFDNKARADMPGYRTRLAERFNTNDTAINTILGAVQGAANAYMVFRLAEMTGKPTNFVLDNYKGNKGKGWGAIAKSLGIKPGSPEFHALKNGNNLWGVSPKVQGKGKGADKGKGKGKGADKELEEEMRGGKGKGKK